MHICSGAVLNFIKCPCVQEGLFDVKMFCSVCSSTLVNVEFEHLRTTTGHLPQALDLITGHKQRVLYNLHSQTHELDRTGERRSHTKKTAVFFLKSKVPSPSRHIIYVHDCWTMYAETLPKETSRHQCQCLHCLCLPCCSHLLLGAGRGQYSIYLTFQSQFALMFPFDKTNTYG